jgi:hypothetical protein
LPGGQAEACAKSFERKEVNGMFARVATFEGGDSKRLMEMNQERMDSGTMNGPEGIKRVLVLEDGSDGTRLFISFFDSREAIAAAEARFDAMGDEIPEDVRGRRTGVSVYEVAVDQEM